MGVLSSNLFMSSDVDYIAQQYVFIMFDLDFEINTNMKLNTICDLVLFLMKEGHVCNYVKSDRVCNDIVASKYNMETYKLLVSSDMFNVQAPHMIEYKASIELLMTIRSAATNIYMNICKQIKVYNKYNVNGLDYETTKSNLLSEICTLVNDTEKYNMDDGLATDRENSKLINYQKDYDIISKLNKSHIVNFDTIKCNYETFSLAISKALVDHS